MNKNDDIIRKKVLEQVPRILTQFDRGEKSLSFGCGDRYYWKYKMHDYLNVRFQEAAFLFAMLHEHDFSGNVYFQNKKIKKLTQAMIKRWSETQRRNGSFDENYPFENSFVATAFSLFTSTEALLLFDSPIDNELEMTLRKAGKWLIKNDNYQVSNQVAAAVAALYNLSHLLKDDTFVAPADKKLQKIITAYDKNGFWPEYGGFDIGYSTIGSYYLLKATRRMGQDDERVGITKQQIKTNNEKIENEIDEFGNFDFQNKSRKTQYLFPYCFKYQNSSALNNIVNGLVNEKILQPAWMDDRFCIFFTINYLDTYLID